MALTEEERLEARRANQRRYNNSDKGREKRAKWLSNPDNYIRTVKNSRKCAKRHPETKVAIEQRRRERKILSNDSKLTKQDIIDLKNKFNNKCFNCGSDNRLQVDHFFPLSMGYALTENNRIILCISCNSSKCDNHPHDFFKKQQLQELRDIYGVDIDGVKDESHYSPKIKKDSIELLEGFCEETKNKIITLLEERKNIKLNKDNYDKGEFKRLLKNIAHAIYKLKNPEKAKEYYINNRELVIERSKRNQENRKDARKEYLKKRWQLKKELKLSKENSENIVNTLREVA